VFQIGNPGLFAIGDPSIFLGYQYWLHKWLPDPPPEARDAVLLSYIYALSAALTDATDRSDLERSVATLLTRHVGTGSSPAPQPAPTPAPTYTAPARVAVTRMGTNRPYWERRQFRLPQPVTGWWSTTSS
jgi:hypothetical protein